MNTATTTNKEFDAVTVILAFLNISQEQECDSLIVTMILTFLNMSNLLYIM